MRRGLDRVPTYPGCAKYNSPPISVPIVIVLYNAAGILCAQLICVSYQYVFFLQNMCVEIVSCLNLLIVSVTCF